MKGRIKFFSENEGYGFIQGEDCIEYYFDIHGIKSFTSVPKMGNSVTFDVSPNKKDNLFTANNVEISTSDTDTKKEDQRVTCPKCHKKVIPRLSMQDGVPAASFCPFCGGLIKDFTKDSNLEVIIKIVIMVVLVAIMIYKGTLFNFTIFVWELIKSFFS